MLISSRSRCSTVLLLLLSFSSFSGSSLPGQEKPTEQQIASWKQEADMLLERAIKQAKTLEALQELLLEEQRHLSQTKQKLKSAEETVAKADETLKPLKESVAKAEAELKPLAEYASKAKEAAEAAKGTDQEKATADAAAKASAAEEPARKKLTGAQTALATAEQMIAEAKKSQEILKANVLKVEKNISKTENEITDARKKQAELLTQEVNFRKQYQTALIDQGKLVSFTHGVAPIYAKRCLACHNARTAKGRYNMENYASIMKGGESGQVIDPGDGELSTLYIMCEDGSMPKDADPLSPEELSLIKKWIDTGAILDAGISPSAELITVIPKSSSRPLPIHIGSHSRSRHWRFLQMESRSPVLGTTRFCCGTPKMVSWSNASPTLQKEFTTFNTAPMVLKLL